MSFAEDDGIVEVCVNLTGNIYAGLVVEDGTATGKCVMTVPNTV